MKRFSRREQRLIEQGSLEVGEVLKDKIFKIKTVNPITENQERTFDAFKNGKNLLLTGTAGTGKSFVACYLGLTEVFKNPNKYESGVIIVRSVVPTRDMGFIPGGAREKAQVYEAPYYSIFHEMSDIGNAYEQLKGKNLVQFMTTSFIRGITLRNAIVIIDEIQNMTAGELHSIITRIGKNCRVILCGDLRQNDLVQNRQLSGFSDFIKILEEMRSFTCIEFDRNDIVRSSLVKDYIITRETLEDKGMIASHVN